MMQLSPAGLARLKTFEGTVLHSYQDRGGVWTIGTGHTGPDVGPNTVWTQAQADHSLRIDVQWAEAAVNSRVTMPLEQGEFDAVCSLCFNIGEGAFAASTLLRLLNQGEYDCAARQFRRWSLVDGEVSQGLLNRRTAEADMFEEARYA
jgi:lysozyme